MRRIYSARTELDAHDVRILLESHDIQAAVVGESAAFPNFAFTPTAEPGVAVDDADVERAAELIEQYVAGKQRSTRRTTWKCSHCGEIGEEQFEICWKCDAPRPELTDDPAIELPAELVADSSTSMEETGTAPIFARTELSAQARLRVWFEVIALLAITQPWWGREMLFSPFTPILEWGTFAGESIYFTVVELLIATFALLFIALSDQPWSTFGLNRLQPLQDLFGAGLLCIVALFAVSMSNGLFYDLAHEWLPADKFHRLFNQSGTWIPPQSAGDVLLALAASLCIGFAEELVFRGIFIPRFEQLFRSTGASVLLSSVLFATMHWPQGPLSVWNALGMGLIFGITFAHFRHLWPLVFAHALWDFEVIVRSGGGLP
jgi:membrane protease YdiL (CAAX protease family)